jgi:hypothetical protein
VRQYLNDLQHENPLEPEPHQQDKVSTTDPDATYCSKGDKAPTLGYLGYGKDSFGSIHPADTMDTEPDDDPEAGGKGIGDRVAE